MSSSNILDLNIPNQYFNSVNQCNHDSSRNFTSFQGLTVLQINARSIDSSYKFDKFLSFLVNIKFSVDVIVVGETYLKYETAELRNLPSYMQYPACRDTSGGGLSIYVSFRLDHKFLEKIDTYFFLSFCRN